MFCTFAKLRSTKSNRRSKLYLDAVLRAVVVGPLVSQASGRSPASPLPYRVVGGKTSTYFFMSRRARSQGRRGRSTSQSIGTEFICTPVSAESSAHASDFFQEYLEGDRAHFVVRPRHDGFTGVIDARFWTANDYQVDDLPNPNSPMHIINSVVTEASNPGIYRSAVHQFHP